jgi:nucleotide-binding universal stress UspA family protein
MLPEIKKILYCTDLSKNAEYACRYAIYLARQTGADIYVLNVTEMPSPDAMITLESYIKDFSGREAFVRQRLEQTRKLLTERLHSYLADLPEDKKPAADHIKAINVCEAHPVDEILRQSKSLGVDLIVMGTHRKGVAHTFLGSVSKRVMSNSRIPVLVVPLPAE